MLMWRASNAPSRENIEAGSGNAQHELEMRRVSASSNGKEWLNEDVDDVVKMHANALTITPMAHASRDATRGRASDKEERRKRREVRRRVGPRRKEAAARKEAGQEAKRDSETGKSRQRKKKSKEKGRAKRRSDWVELETDEGKKYYFNEMTEETSWTKPKGSSATRRQGGDGDRKAAAAAAAADWLELETNEGKKYYFNEKTEESSWAKPKGSSADHVHGKEGRGNTTGGKHGNGDWLEMQTDEGKTYFYNKASRKTSWSKEV